MEGTVWVAFVKTHYDFINDDQQYWCAGIFSTEEKAKDAAQKLKYRTLDEMGFEESELICVWQSYTIDEELSEGDIG